MFGDDNRKIFETIIMTTISFFSAFSISLNRYATDKSKNKHIYIVLYVSDALVSGISGLLLGLVSRLFFPNNFLVWVIASGIGGLGGKGLLMLIFGRLLKKYLNIETGKLLVEEENDVAEKDEKDDNKSDEKRRREYKPRKKVNSKKPVKTKDDKDE